MDNPETYNIGHIKKQGEDKQIRITTQKSKKKGNMNPTK